MTTPFESCRRRFASLDAVWGELGRAGYALGGRWGRALDFLSAFPGAAAGRSADRLRAGNGGAGARGRNVRTGEAIAAGAQPDPAMGEGSEVASPEPSREFSEPEIEVPGDRPRSRNVPRRKSRPPWQRWPWLPIAAIVLLALLLRLYQLGTESLWMDEMLSANRGLYLHPYFADRLRITHNLALRFWMQFGSSDSWWRALSIVVDLGNVGLVYALGRITLGQPAGLLAALAYALSPAAINHAQEVRMYAFISFFSLAGSFWLALVLARPTKARVRWWAVMRALALATSPLTVVLLGADGVLVLETFFKQRVWLLRCTFGASFALLTWLPSLLTLPSAVSAYSQGLGRQQPPGAIDVLTVPPRLTSVWPVSPFADDAIVKGELGLLALALWGLLALGWFARRKQPSTWWLVAWLLLPGGAILVESLIATNIWVTRYLLFLLPYFLLLVAAGAAFLWQRQRRAILAIALLYVLMTGFGLRFYYTTLYRPDWRGAAAYIREREQAGDTIGFLGNAPRSDLAFERYYHGDAPVYFTPRIETLKTYGKSGVAAELAEWNPPSRLWLVCWEQCRNPDLPVWIAEAVVGPEAQIADRQRLFEGVVYNSPLDVFLIVPEDDPATPIDRPGAATEEAPDGRTTDGGENDGNGASDP